MMINILVFAGLAEAVGGPAVTVNIEPPATVADVKRHIGDMHPAARPLLASCFAAINQTYADDEAVVHRHDEVAFIPPVSGG